MREFESKTSLTRLRQCAARYHKRYVEKAPRMDDYSPAARAGVVFHEVVERAIKSHHGFTPQIPKRGLLEILGETEQGTHQQAQKEVRALIDDVAPIYVGDVEAVEERLVLETPAGKVQGYADVIRRPEEGLVVVEDWKTGHHVKSRDEHLMEDLQLAVYLPAARRRWPDADIRMDVTYVRKGFSMKFWWTEDLDDVWTATIEALLRRRNAEEQWEETPGSHCVYCPFRESCASYHDFISQALGTIQGMDEIQEAITEEHEVAKWAEQRAYLKDVEDIVTDRRKEIDRRLRMYLQETFQKNLRVEAGTVYLYSRARRNIPDKDAVVAAVSQYTDLTAEEVREKIVKEKVLLSKLDKVLKELPEHKRDALERALDGLINVSRNEYVGMRTS